MYRNKCATVKKEKFWKRWKFAHIWLHNYTYMNM